jgi:hypothetical protein
VLFRINPRPCKGNAFAGKKFFLCENPIFLIERWGLGIEVFGEK